MKILEVCVDLDGGGIDRYLLNYCSRIKDIHFDFAVVDSKIGILEPKLTELGCNIYRVPRQSAGLKANYNALKEIMTNGKYDAVHVHLGHKSVVALLCAKNCGIQSRIVHAHLAFPPENFKQKSLRILFTFLTKRLATSLAACGIDAARWEWGDKAYKNGKVTIHNNAIEAETYAFSQEKRKKARDLLGISDDVFAVGHVGRLCPQKNQLRLIDIFVDILKKRTDAVLFLVGRGEHEQKIKDKVQRLGISDSVKLLGVRDDVPMLLNAFDIFVFPSTYEGLPFTLIETQCNGLYAVSADTVTDYIKLSDCVEFLSLQDDDTIWADKALELSVKGHATDGADVIRKNGYDIDTESKKLREFYINSTKQKGHN